MSDGFSILAESFRQKFFGRIVGAGFSRLQLVLLRKRFQMLLQISFIIFSFWVIFFLTSGGKFTAGLLKLHFFLVLRHLLSWLTSKKLNMFQKLRILIENFHNFDERFPAALNKLHSKCPLKNFWRVFFLWKHQECFVNSEILVGEFGPFFRQISGQNSKVALRATRKTFRGKTSFLRNFFSGIFGL